MWNNSNRERALQSHNMIIICLYFDIPQMSTFKCDTNRMQWTEPMEVCAGSCMYRKRFIHTTWRHGGHVRLGCIIDFVWFFWSCLNWPNTTDPTIYTSNNMINTIVPSITYKLSPSPHIRMWKKYFTYKINFRIISHTCMCKWHLIWSDFAMYSKELSKSSLHCWNS